MVYVHGQPFADGAFQVNLHFLVRHKTGINERRGRCVLIILFILFIGK